MSSDLDYRRTCFSSSEKSLLMKLVLENYDVIESTECSYANNFKKRAAWLNLTERYNQLCDGVSRSDMQLVNLWRKMKLKLKKQHLNSESNPEQKDQDFTQIMPLLIQEAISRNDAEDNEVERRIEVVNISQAINKTNNAEDGQLPQLILNYEDDVDITDTNPVNVPKKTMYQQKRLRKLGERQQDSKRDKNILLRRYLEKEHSLKVKHLIESHAWAKEEHKLKVNNLKLETLILQKQLERDSLQNNRECSPPSVNEEQ